MGLNSPAFALSGSAIAFCLQDVAVAPDRCPVAFAVLCFIYKELDMQGEATVLCYVSCAKETFAEFVAHTTCNLEWRN
jgi:hypothetical protein